MKALAVFLTAIPLALLAQLPQPERPKFEVASIKQCDAAPNVGGLRGGGGGGNTTVETNRIRMNCITVREVIQWAYLRFPDGKPLQVAPSQWLLNQPFEGSPAWLTSDRYTIEAKSESPQTREMMRGPMMQALLEDRFKLKIRRETRDIPVYAVVVAKGGHKLQPAKEKCISPEEFRPNPNGFSPGDAFPCGAYTLKNGGVETYGSDLAGLARQFSVRLDREVVDRTGLTGVFDIHLDLAPSDILMGFTPDPNTPNNPLAGIKNALPRLGLALEDAKVPAIQLVIDRIERPSEN
jgi:uncharacterized protein (TIGR03435 family)